MRQMTWVQQLSTNLGTPRNGAKLENPSVELAIHCSSSRYGCLCWQLSAQQKLTFVDEPGLKIICQTKLVSNQIQALFMYSSTAEVAAAVYDHRQWTFPYLHCFSVDGGIQRD